MNREVGCERRCVGRLLEGEVSRAASLYISSTEAREDRLVHQADLAMVLDAPGHGTTTSTYRDGRRRSAARTHAEPTVSERQRAILGGRAAWRAEHTSHREGSSRRETLEAHYPLPTMRWPGDGLEDRPAPHFRRRRVQLAGANGSNPFTDQPCRRLPRKTWPS